MKREQQFLERLFSQKFPEEYAKKTAFFDKLTEEESYIELIKKAFAIQEEIINDTRMRYKIEEIKEERLPIPNGTSGKPYQFYLDIDGLGWDIVHGDFMDLEDTGLAYNPRTQVLEGTPTKSGDLRVRFCFRMNGEDENSTLHEKVITIIINPNPRDLWKNLPSNQDAIFWKPDSAHDFTLLGEKRLVVASQRGRSHANNGTFRDDGYAFKHFDNDWSIVVVADGAGSAKVSREGSRAACEAVVTYFEEQLTAEVCASFDEIIRSWKEEENETGEQQLSQFVSSHLGKAAWAAHQRLKLIAKATDHELRDFNTTLIFSLIKKVEVGYAILSFGVGDCPIVLLNKDVSEVTLLNKLDVGEFGGGTRFITMADIFSKSDFYQTRFSFKIVSDFSYLMLMTDGIYDPKFEVEANLEKIEMWQQLLKDLGGNNEDGHTVEFHKDNENASEQLLEWLNFWSVGNHDDRTLAIIF